MKSISLLIIFSFLISGCSEKQAPLIEKKYVKQEVPKLRVMNPYPKLYIKYYPLDSNYYKVKKSDAERASKRAMQRLQQNRVYTHDAKTFNELYHNRLEADIFGNLNSILRR